LLDKTFQQEILLFCIKQKRCLLFLFFGLLGLETITPKRTLGAGIILLGATVILSEGFTWEWNIWNFLVILATAIAPVANYFQKATVKLMPAIGYTAYRSLFAGTILILASALV
jgi:drug/metabolite transporter (DMT)-like permease